MHLSEKTIESHITKALKTLRNMLEQKYPDSVNLSPGIIFFVPRDILGYKFIANVERTGNLMLLLPI